MSNTFPAMVGVTVGLSTTVRKLTADQHKSLTGKPVLAGFLVGVILYIVDAIDHEIATAFGGLILVTAVLVNGSAIFAATNKVLA